MITNQFLGKDYTKTKNSILSCTKGDQLRSAKNMMEIYRIKNPSLIHQHKLLLAYYQAKEKEFNPIKVNQEIEAI